jgi:hypothetical protein
MYFAKLFMGLVDGLFEILLIINLYIISLTKQATVTPLFSLLCLFKHKLVEVTRFSWWELFSVWSCGF